MISESDFSGQTKKMRESVALLLCTCYKVGREYAFRLRGRNG